MMQLARRASLVVVLLLLASLGTASADPHAAVGLTFHQAVTATAGLAEPGRFERVKRPVEEAELYVARAAALVIHPGEITRVVITRKPVYADLPSITEATRRQLGLPGQPQPLRITGHYYMAVVHVDTQAARRFHTLTAQNVGQRFDIRFNGTRLAIPSVYGPVPSGQITIGLTEWTRAEIERAFAALKAKLTWETDER